MTARSPLFKFVSALLLASVMLVMFATMAFAQEPRPITGPRLNPPAIPHTNVILPATIYNKQPRPVQLARSYSSFTKHSLTMSRAPAS